VKRDHSLFGFGFSAGVFFCALVLATPATPRGSMFALAVSMIIVMLLTRRGRKP
jgi:hypothetical protein